MDLEVGGIYTGKVTGITKFGAFVTLAPGVSGLVHISEIADTFVSNVGDFLTQGQEVTVKLLSRDENGRINLSIKQAQPKPVREPAEPRRVRQEMRQSRPASIAAPPPAASVQEPLPNADFEDKLKRFMQDSDSKISGIRQYSEKKTSRRGGRR